MLKYSLSSHRGAPSPLVDLQVQVKKQLHFNYYLQKDNEKEKCSHGKERQVFVRASTKPFNSQPNFSFITVDTTLSIAFFDEGANLSPFKQEEGTTGKGLEWGSVGLCLELGPK